MNLPNLLAMAVFIATVFPGCAISGPSTTQEKITRQFASKEGGKLVLDVDFGSVEISTNGRNEITVDVARSVSGKSKEAEEEFLRNGAVTFKEEGNTLFISAKNENADRKFWRGFKRTEAKYLISVPANFDLALKTSGGSVNVRGITGPVKARTAGGSLSFAHLRGPLEGKTSGGSIRVHDCQGPVNVDTSGGSITLENVVGKVDGSTSGGSISARFQTLTDDVKLHTMGGSVKVRVPSTAGMDLDASTSGGSVKSDFAEGSKESKSKIQAAINGGGKQIHLRTGGGSIYLQKI